jgi:hypothetical protein
MHSISLAADEHYKSSDANGNPTFEASKQVIAAKRRLVNFYCFNNSGAPVYLKLQDSANAGTDKGPCTVYPITANNFLSGSVHGGDRMENGIYMALFTDAACTIAAGAVGHFKVDWTAYL